MFSINKKYEYQISSFLHMDKLETAPDVGDMSSMGGGEKPSGEYMMSTFHQFSLKASQPERLCKTNISAILICASHGYSVIESELDK